MGLLYSLAVVYEALLFNDPSIKFLTRWGVWLVMLYYAAALLSHYSSSFHRPAIVLYVTAWTLEFPICLVFWTWIYPNSNMNMQPFFSYSAHGGLFLVLIIELSLNSVVFKWKHFRYPIATAAAYQIVNIYYTVTSGPVYPGLNYGGVESVLMIGLALGSMVGGYWLGVVATTNKTKARIA
jgi:hypothetical protein